jgi:3-hydroxybutyryl-CoA dehydrogenase
MQEMRKIINIGVIGGGLMGSGIAQVFAYNGDFEVKVYDNFISGKDILTRIESNLELLKSKGIYSEDEVSGFLKRISVYDNIAVAVSDADFIIECIPENMKLKQDLFVSLEPLCKPDTILATNTSVMSITEIASLAINRKRIIGTHFWNPPYLIPLVEVVKGDDTSSETMEITMALMKEAGKHPIRVNKDVPGFVANRLQHALWREAISIVDHGIADAATVDEAIKMSFGMRLPVLAPMENADMVGTDLTLAIHDYILKYLESSPEASPLLKDKVSKGELGFKSGKGFQTWTPDQISLSRKRLTEHLIKVIYNK